MQILLLITRISILWYDVIMIDNTYLGRKGDCSLRKVMCRKVRLGIVSDWTFYFLQLKS